MIRIPSPSILKTICHCSDCHLHEFAKNPYVPGRWVNEENHPETPLLILLGEAPGKWEDEAGACFQHTSLKNLEKALGDNLNLCYLTNVCRCIPWADNVLRENASGAKVRKPTPIEMECCLPWLLLEISKFPTSVPIVAMGATAFSALMPSMKDARITEIAGREFELDVHGKKYKLFAQVHPASISYNPTLSEKFYSVFNSIISRVTGEVVTQKESEYWEILDPSKAIQKLQEAKQLYLDGQIKYVVTDTETSGFYPWKDRIIMFGLSHTADKKGYSIPTEIQNRFDFPDFPTDLYSIDFKISDHDLQLIKLASRDLFNTVPIVGHNIKFDLKMMAYHNYLDLNKVRIYNDTLLLSAVLIGRQWRGDSLGLKEMSQKLLGLDQSWDWVIDEWLKRYKRVADRTFANIPTCVLGKYCALDHFYTRELHEKLYPMIEEHKCQELINSLNIATVAYSESELKGIDIDWDTYDLVKKKSDALMIDINKRILRDPHIKKMMMEKYEKELDENSKKKRPKDPGFFYQKLIDGEYFSVGSVKDKRELIYGRYGVEVKELTDKGEPSTSKDAISGIKSNTDNERLKELCENLLEYNKFAKIKSTYVDNLPEDCDDSKTYHCEFNIAGTVTGRLCLHEDTVVNTISGDRKIKDIPEGEVIYVYSYDLENHKMTVSEAVSLGVTRKEKRAAKITLDNGKEIITTVDHKFLTKDEEYIEAQNLKIGEELMSIHSLENITVSSKEFIEYASEVDFYDLSVPECHNFGIEGSIIVHNSSGFHTLPKKSSVKYLYTSKNHKESGSIWLSPDMSQLELRVTAGIANEPSWINAYKNGEDLHQRTAANMFSIPFEEVTKDQRKIGKCVVGETIIETDHGPMKIEDIVPQDSPDDKTVPYDGDVKVLTLDGYRPITEVYRMEDAEVCEVETEDGQKLVGTLHHRFVVGFNEDGSPIFKKAIDLTEDDYVYVLDEDGDEIV